MSSKESEYKEIFLSEALENIEEINRVLTVLEKNTQDKNAVHALFRITHTLKGNAAGMGFQGIAEMAHVLEDFFGEVRDGRLMLNDQTCQIVFKAVDTLAKLVNALKDNTEVKYLGIKTKLEVLINRCKTDETKEAEKVDDNNALLPLTQNEEDIIKSLVNNLQEDDESETLETENKLSFSDLVQVPVRKLDNLLNLVGELIIEKDRILANQNSNGTYNSNEYARLSRISSDLQYSVMDVRLVQVGFLFNKFHRVVRDAANLEKKKVQLKLEGTDTEIDRNVLQVISDSLIHIIRNSVGHGVELPSERLAANKSEEGTVWLKAENDTDAVLISIIDDGKGLNFEKIKEKAIQKNLISQEDATKLTDDELSMLIFEPGFSTMEQVTAIAGRGVGMDVVKKTIDSIGGTIKIISQQGLGTTIQLRLPSSMAVKSCLLLELTNEVFAIPLAYTESVISLYRSDIHKAGGGLVATHLGKTFNVVFLKDVFDAAKEQGLQGNYLQRTLQDIHPEEKLEIVIVNFNQRKVGLVVDKLLQQKEIVEKPMMKPVDKIKFISGVTILGSGKVCLVLNIPFILHAIYSVGNNRNAKSQNLN